MFNRKKRSNPTIDSLDQLELEMRRFDSSNKTYTAYRMACRRIYKIVEQDIESRKRSTHSPATSTGDVQ